MQTLTNRQQGREVQFDLYGINKITSEIQSLNVNGIIKYQDHPQQRTIHSMNKLQDTSYY